MLVTTMNEVRTQMRLTSGTTEDSLPQFDTAESEHLVPIIGFALYQDLVAKYAAATLTDKESELLRYCQAVIIPFAYIRDLPLLQAQVTDTGIVAMESGNARKAFKWEYNNIIETLYARGYAAQENLILFLKVNRADFPLWATSPYNSADFAVIRDGADLSGVISLQQPHRCYMLLKGIINTVGEMYLLTAIGEDYYEALNNRIKSDSLTGYDREVLPRLRMAVARKALAIASVEMNIKFGAHGFTIVDILRDVPDEGRTAASTQQVAGFEREMSASARESLQAAITYMNKKATAEVFPEWFGSDLYRDPTASPKRFDNSKRKGLFVAR